MDPIFPPCVATTSGRTSAGLLSGPIMTPTMRPATGQTPPSWLIAVVTITAGVLVDAGAASPRPTATFWHRSASMLTNSCRCLSRILCS